MCKSISDHIEIIHEGRSNYAVLPYVNLLELENYIEWMLDKTKTHPLVVVDEFLDGHTAAFSKGKNDVETIIKSLYAEWSVRYGEKSEQEQSYNICALLLKVHNLGDKQVEVCGKGDNYNTEAPQEEIIYPEAEVHDDL